MVIAVIICLISVYFGMSIANANNNFLIEHLNVADKIDYYPKKVVPALTFRAAIVTSPFLLAIIVLTIVTIRQTQKRKVRNLLIGGLVAVGIIAVVDVLTLVNPVQFEFSQWGYVWVTMGLIIIWANFLSALIKEN